MERVKCSKLRNLRVVFIAVTGLFFIIGMVLMEQTCVPQVLPLSSTNQFTVAYGTPYFFQAWPPDFVKPDAFQTCPFNNCFPTKDRSTADAVVFHHWDIYPFILFAQIGKKHRNQVWIYYGIESPARTNWFSKYLNGLFNWTATYKSSSDIHTPYSGYERIPPIDIKSQKRLTALKDKTKTAFIVVSHCHTWSKREDLVEDLRKVIDVDVFGKCGEPCPNGCNFTSFEKEYKFYLAFENSKCAEYITEKVWLNALNVGLIPVVLGGHSRRDYEDLLPPNSFIYAEDFPSPKHLAAHLTKVGSNATLYNTYLMWKRTFRVSFQYTNKHLCAICKALNNKTLMSTPQTHNDMDTFWNVTDDCRGAGPGVQNSWFENIMSWFLYVFGIL